MFLNTIAELNRGATVPELDAKLLELTQQVKATGRPGSLTFKLTIKPQDAEGECVEITDQITLSSPKPIRRTAIFYTTEDGLLTRNDPNQPDLPFKKAPAAEPLAQSKTA